MGEGSNWQYDPFSSLSCTIGNQFEILMLVESLELAGIHVVSANTRHNWCSKISLIDGKLLKLFLPQSVAIYDVAGDIIITRW